jgi:hypothetical protein
MKGDIITQTTIFFRKYHFIISEAANKIIIGAEDRCTLSPSQLRSLPYRTDLGNSTSKQILITFLPQMQALFANNIILHSYAPEIL